MKRALFAAGCVLIAALIFAAPSLASTKGKAINATKKFASRACQRDPNCTRFGWQCGKPRRHNTQVPCKAYVDEDNNHTECLIGLTWGVANNKIFLLKYGKPQCYPI